MPASDLLLKLSHKSVSSNEQQRMVDDRWMTACRAMMQEGMLILAAQIQ